MTTEVNVTIPAVDARQLSEGDMRNLFSQLADMIVDQSKLSQQVAAMAETLRNVQDHASFVEHSLRGEIESMRSALVTANAERDAMRAERDEAKVSYEALKGHYDALASDYGIRGQRINELEAKVRDLDQQVTVQSNMKEDNWRNFQAAMEDVARLTRERDEANSRIEAAQSALSNVVSGFRPFAASA
jgi:chromosome segregation ATPase